MAVLTRRLAQPSQAAAAESFDPPTHVLVETVTRLISALEKQQENGTTALNNGIAIQIDELRELCNTIKSLLLHVRALEVGVVEKMTHAVGEMHQLRDPPVRYNMVVKTRDFHGRILEADFTAVGEDQ